MMAAVAILGSLAALGLGIGAYQEFMGIDEEGREVQQELDDTPSRRPF